MKILVIEDEKMLADSIKAMLERKGFQVETVYDGESGAEYAMLGIYDLLILDVMMPKMDGYEVTRQVRRNRCNTPILMLTAIPSMCACLRTADSVFKKCLQKNYGFFSKKTAFFGKLRLLNFS